ncbi:MAG: type II toxin-antitoxin system RelE/ParE family toxin [Alphaproteobacteria bacterium]
MSFTVRVAGRAQKSLRRIPPADLRRITAALEAMHNDPLAGDVVKLKDTVAFRRRVGDYRIIFIIDFEQAAVGIVDIQRRTTTTYR